MKKDDSDDLGCLLLIITAIVCATAWEIAKLFATKGTP